MLREATEARFERRMTPVGRRYAFVPGRRPDPVASWGPRRFRAMWRAQESAPVLLAEAVDGPRAWWAFEGRVWAEDDELAADDVVALVRERERRRDRRLARARDVLAADDRSAGARPSDANPGRTARGRPCGSAGTSRVAPPSAEASSPSTATPARRGIALDVRRAVWERDGGRCQGCGATFDLQYDHVIPVALGGGDGIANLQVLCGTCNREKGATLG